MLIHNKDDIEFVTEFPCLLGHPVESTHLFAMRVVDSRPTVFLHPSSGHNCLTGSRLQMFLKPQVCVAVDKCA